MKKFILFAIILLGCKEQDNVIKLTSITGSNLNLIRENSGFVVDGQKDKIILFDIFGSFCAPCRNEASNLTNLQLKYSNKLVIIGLDYYENLSNEEILNKFVKQFDAYYFILNSKDSQKIVDEILKDIKFNQKNLTLPFKVMLKDGKYINFGDKKFIIGSKNLELIKENLD